MRKVIYEEDVLEGQVPLPKELQLDIYDFHFEYVMKQLRGTLWKRFSDRSAYLRARIRAEQVRARRIQATYTGSFLF